MRKLLAGLVVAVAMDACGAATTNGTEPFQGFDGCNAGAGSAIAFLQRTLDEIGDADVTEAPDIVPSFDHDVEVMMLRAREVHCTEEGFNKAIADRAGELDGDGPAARLLIASVEARGLGSLDVKKGGPIRLTGG
jgi:hypothetical protein